MTNASHKWPDSQTLANALGFLYLSGQEADVSSLTKSQLAVYCENQQARIDSLKEHGDYLKATLVARNMSYTSPFNNDKIFVSSYNDLKAHPEYINVRLLAKTAYLVSIFMKVRIRVIMLWN